ncbi:MAG: nucleotidyltransferase domain-containing protein [Candidatus Woesearchaeota archaeon]
MGSDEYDKRMRILNEILSKIKTEFCEGVILTGSMAFESVTEKSDIDILFIVKKDKIDSLLNNPFFRDCSNYYDEKVDLFKIKEAIFWLIGKIEGVDIGMGFVSWDLFNKFCCLECPYYNWIRSKYKEMDKEIKNVRGVVVEDEFEWEKYGRIFNYKFQIFKECLPLSRILFTQLVVSRALIDSGLIEKNIDRLRKTLLSQYGNDSLNLFSYVLSKSPDIKKFLHKSSF